jgi:hypothetical protein
MSWKKHVGQRIWKAFTGGGQKTTGTETVNPFKFKASKNKLEKNLREVNVSLHKMKGKIHGDYQKMEREIEPFRRKLKQTLQNLKKKD